jgi:RNA polymerase sigma factor (sigma-70 family)
MDKDFNIKITVRNARLLNEIRKSYESVAEFSRKNNLCYQTVCQYVAMKRKPISFKGWSKTALELCDALNVEPQKLWPQHIAEMQIKKSSTEMEIDFHEFSAIAANKADPLHITNQRQAIAAFSEALTPRERKVMVYRYVDKMTYKQIGEKINVGAQRALQIEKKALRRMYAKAKNLGYLASDIRKDEWGVRYRNGKDYLTGKGHELFVDEGVRQ